MSSWTSFKHSFYRIKRVRDIPDDWFSRKIVLKGKVTSVGDGDGLRMLHQPKLAYFFGVWGHSEHFCLNGFIQKNQKKDTQKYSGQKGYFGYSISRCGCTRGINSK
jgi:hypothetical protein